MLHSNLTSLELSEGLEQIGVRAFCFTALGQVTFPKTLRVIEDAAFAYTRLAGVLIPDSVQHVHSDAFGGTPMYEKEMEECPSQQCHEHTAPPTAQRVPNVSAYTNVKSPKRSITEEELDKLYESGEREMDEMTRNFIGIFLFVGLFFLLLIVSWIG